MTWDYAELSKMAKRAGGPEELIRIISDSARHAGRKEMIPVVVLSTGAAVLATIAFQKVKEYFGHKNKCTPAEVEAAKAELIQGIKDYDAEHPENEENDNISDELPE